MNNKISYEENEILEKSLILEILCDIKNNHDKIDYYIDKYAFLLYQLIEIARNKPEANQI